MACKIAPFFRYHVNWNAALHPKYFSILNSDIRYTVLVYVWRQDAELLDVSVQVQVQAKSRILEGMVRVSRELGVYIHKL